jgi:hypothetical protein
MLCYAVLCYRSKGTDELKGWVNYGDPPADRLYLPVGLDY